MPHGCRPVGAGQWNGMTRLLGLRRLVQVALFFLFVGIPGGTSADFRGFQGTLFSFDCFGVPFAEPLGVVQIVLSGAFPDGKRVLGALTVLCMTLCLGRVFCSWFCPFGLLSEGVQGVRVLFFRVTGWKPRGSGFPSRPGTRLLMTGAGLVLVALLGVPFLNLLFLPETLRCGLRDVPRLFFFESIPPFTEYLSILPLAAILVVLLCEGVYGARVWCRWICPQSVLLSLLSRIPAGLRLRRDPAQCLCHNDRRACRAACSLGIDPRAALSPVECTHCGACVLACSRVHAGKPAALFFAFLSLSTLEQTSSGRSSQES